VVTKIQTLQVIIRNGMNGNRVAQTCFVLYKETFPTLFKKRHFGTIYHRVPPPQETKEKSIGHKTGSRSEFVTVLERARMEKISCTAKGVREALRQAFSALRKARLLFWLFYPPRALSFTSHFIYKPFSGIMSLSTDWRSEL